MSTNGTTNANYVFKMLVVGDCGVGKTSLMQRFVDDKFSPNFISTIGVEFRTKCIQLDDKLVKLQIWDTAGQERFECICTNYYRRSHGAIVVYDATDPGSLQSVRTRWLPTIRRHAKQRIWIILVGNKTDLRDHARARGVDTDVILQDAKLLAQEEGVLLLATSAKDGSHVDTAIHSLARELVEANVRVPGQVEKVTDISKRSKGGFFTDLCHFFSRRECERKGENRDHTIE